MNATAMGSLPTTARLSGVPPAKHHRAASLAALLVLVASLFVAVATPTAAAGRDGTRDGATPPRAGQHGGLDCDDPTAIRRRQRVIVPARTVRLLCRIFDDGRSAATKAASARDGGDGPAAAAADAGKGVEGTAYVGECYVDDWGVSGSALAFDLAIFCATDWYDNGYYYATSYVGMNRNAIIIVYWDGSYTVYS